MCRDPAVVLEEMGVGRLQFMYVRPYHRMYCINFVNDPCIYYL